MDPLRNAACMLIIVQDILVPFGTTEAADMVQAEQKSCIGRNTLGT